MAVGTALGIASLLGGAASGIGGAIAARKMRKRLEEAQRKYMSEGPMRIDPSMLDTDPSLRESQMRALTELGDIYRQGGLTNADRAALELGQMEAAGQARQLRGAADMASRRRGGGGSLQEYLGQMGANQAATSGQYAANLQQQLGARNRALNALQEQTRLAGSIQSADEQRAMARAQMEQWNQQMRDQWRRTGMGLEQGNLNERMQNVGQGFQLGSQMTGNLMDMFKNIVPEKKWYGINDTTK